ncbi:hypothetical protein [Demequina lutea]|uniref:Uncharacterized protein n=1 Tax=Demequina lutea TaxID=431489 RepID=A0A7Y9ZAA3_9MICO|nr:hypothetical protein [Demequina lutea]NYI41496.1 hypothetical protein [Demequina lutea]
MTDSGFEYEAPTDVNLDASAAARLLADAERVGARTLAHTDFRAHAVIQGWVAAALFVYVGTYLLLFFNPGPEGSAVFHAYNYVGLVMVPFLLLTQLVQGARNRLLISVAMPRGGLRLLLMLPGLIVFLAAMVASVADVGYPWWANLVAAAFVAVPMGVLAFGTARKAGGMSSHRRPATPSAPLGRAAATATVTLGISFGVIAALTPYSWYFWVTVLPLLAVIVLSFGSGSRWGLPSIGSEWGQSQWFAFGITFTLLFALAVVAARTSWDTPLVATLSGVAVAVPLVCTTLRTYRRT